MTLTRSGIAVSAGAVLLLAAGITADWPELTLLGGGCVAALVVAAVWMLRGRPDLAALRTSTPKRPRAGDTITVTLRVTNPSDRTAAPVLAVDEVDGTAHEVAIPAIAAGGGHTASYTFAAHRRGRLPVGRLTVEQSDPLRLMAASARTGDESMIRVYPRWHPGLVPFRGGGAFDDEGATSATSRLGGVAFHSLRDFRPGDQVRQIHWRATAKRGVATVRHQVMPDEPRHLILLDIAAAAFSPDRFEDAVRVAASLAVAVRDAGWGLELRTTRSDRKAVLAPTDGAGRGDHIAALDLLCDVEQVAQGPDLPAAVASLASGGDELILGVVAGRLSDRDRSVLASLRHRFRAMYLIQVDASLPSGRVGGIPHTCIATSEEFATVWNRLPRP